MFGLFHARRQNSFADAFQSQYGFAPPKSLVQWLFLPRQEHHEAFAATGFRPYDPEQVLQDAGRWPSMPPGFIPFADEGSGDAAGLYYPWRLADGRIPVVCFLHETGHLFPLTADVSSFVLRQLLLQPLSDWPDRAPKSDGEQRETAARAARWAKLFEVPERFPEQWSASDTWTSPGCLYRSTMRYRHELINRHSRPAPASALWLAQQRLTEAGPDAAVSAILDELEDAFPGLGGAHLLRARAQLLQGRPEAAASSYMAALRCPIALHGHTSGGGEPPGADPAFPEGPDGEVAAFAASCPHLPDDFVADPLVALAVDRTRQWQDWAAVMGKPDADRLRPSNAAHAARRRELAEAAWEAGDQRTALNQMLNVLFLTWYEPDEGKGAMATLAEWYRQSGDDVTARHAARIAGGGNGGD